MTRSGCDATYIDGGGEGASADPRSPETTAAKSTSIRGRHSIACTAIWNFSLCTRNNVPAEQPVWQEGPAGHASWDRTPSGTLAQSWHSIADLGSDSIPI